MASGAPAPQITCWCLSMTTTDRNLRKTSASRTRGSSTILTNSRRQEIDRGDLLMYREKRTLQHGAPPADGMQRRYTPRPGDRPETRFPHQNHPHPARAGIHRPATSSAQIHEAAPPRTRGSTVYAAAAEEPRSPRGRGWTLLMRCASPTGAGFPAEAGVHPGSPWTQHRVMDRNQVCCPHVRGTDPQPRTRGDRPMRPDAPTTP